MDIQTAYRQQYTPGWTRIDMLLALYDGAIERLELAAESLKSDDQPMTLRLLTRAQLIVCELSLGVDPNYEHAETFKRLYVLAAQAISSVTDKQIGVALHILRTLRTTFAGMRNEAVDLERQGVLKPVQDLHLLHTTA